MPHIIKKLGLGKHDFEYVLYSDNYVYQFKGTKCFGWFCSYTAWDRTLHKILVD